MISESEILGILLYGLESYITKSLQDRKKLQTKQYETITMLNINNI